MIVQLGKFGDCINVLPFAFMKSMQTGQKVDWLIGEKWASLLDGVSYVNPTVWPGSDDDLPGAIAANQDKKLWITQAWMNPDRLRETDSFAKEQWRYVGALHERGKWPLVFDKRDAAREERLKQQFIVRNVKNILLGTTSVSTPYKHSARLIVELHKEFPTANVIHLDRTRATRLYDLIELFDTADLLITIDTCYLHLARCCQVPVIALINDLPITGKAWWHGGTPPPQTVAAWGYNELGDDLNPVITAARNQLGCKIETMAVICDSHPEPNDRVNRAIATHPRGMMYCRDSRPETKKLLALGLDSGKDAVVFTHDDVTFKSDTLDRIKAHLQKFDFGCSRRHKDHIGREIFWFRSDWLRKNWDVLPNPYWSVQKPDLILARWLRQIKGIPTTMQNLNYDFPPVEMADLIYHEDHQSNWSNAEVEGSIEGLHNEKVWAEMV